MSSSRIKEYKDRLICCPYDPLVAIPMSCTVVGFFFFHIAAFGCKTFHTVDSQQRDYDSRSSTTNTRLGYWSVYDDDFGGCLRYSNDRLGSIWKFGRFIGIFGSLLSWVVLGSILFLSCFKYPNPKICFPIISICMGMMSLLSSLLLVGLASKSDRFTRSEMAEFAPYAGVVLAILSAFLWLGGSASMILCMKERNIVPVPTRPLSRHAGPTYPPSVVTTNNPEAAVAAAEDEEEIVFIDEDVDQDRPIPVESPVVDTQVERITDANGNETVITTATTFLFDGSRRVVRTIETLEEP